MNIAINIIPFSSRHHSILLIKNLIRKVAPLQPENQYYILGLEKNEFEYSKISNVHFHCFKKPSHTSLGYKWLLDYKIPTYLKKLKADLIIQADGLLCKYTQTPQWMYAHHEKEANEKMSSGSQASQLLLTGKVVRSSSRSPSRSPPPASTAASPSPTDAPGNPPRIRGNRNTVAATR
jgi:hypothetical protein